MRGVVDARRSARINARACDDRMAALAGSMTCRAIASTLACEALNCAGSALASRKTLGSIQNPTHSNLSTRAAGALTHLLSINNWPTDRVSPSLTALNTYGATNKFAAPRCDAESPLADDRRRRLHWVISADEEPCRAADGRAAVRARQVAITRRRATPAAAARGGRVHRRAALGSPNGQTRLLPLSRRLDRSGSILGKLDDVCLPLSRRRARRCGLHGNGLPRHTSVGPEDAPKFDKCCKSVRNFAR